jgi:alpha-mannosidase
MVRGRVAGGRDPLLVFAAGAVQLSAFKQAEDGKGFIMRVFNPTPEPRSDVARFGFPCESIEETRMDEEPRAGGQRGTGRELALELPPFAVRTFRLLPRRER